MSEEKLVDQIPCNCCGQLRPCPTRPGIWEFCEHVRMVDLGYSQWRRCSIKMSTGKEHREVSEGELLFYPDVCIPDLEDAMSHCEDDEEKEDLKKQWYGPQSWPEHAAWRRISDLPQTNE